MNYLTKLDFADGQNFVIINQRFYDLKFGKTILVAPLEDGSLRILQIDDEIGSLNSKTMFDERKSGISQPIYEYLDRLHINPKVRAFYTQEKLLE